MIAAVSTSILPENVPPQTVTGPGPSRSATPFFFKLPELSDETAAGISKAAAWPTFIGVCRAIRHQQRRGKTERIRQLASDGTIGIGIKQLGRSMGLTSGTVRTQLRKLVKLGLVMVYSPPKVITTDPITGQIKQKQGGRSARTLVMLTVQEHHCRPCKVRSEPHDGVQSEPPRQRYKARSAPPSKDYSNKKQRQRQPLSSGESSSGSRWRGPDEPRHPQAFTGADADAVAYTREKLAREQAKREAEAAERAASRPDSLEATPMNPATVRAADAATAADKPPHSIRESKRDEQPRTAVQPRPTPPQPTRPRMTAGDRAAFDVLNDTPREVIQAKQCKAFNSRKEMLLQQLAAAERAADGVSVTRATIPIEQPTPAGLIGKALKLLTG